MNFNGLVCWLMFHTKFSINFDLLSYTWCWLYSAIASQRLVGARSPQWRRRCLWRRRRWRWMAPRIHTASFASRSRHRVDTRTSFLHQASSHLKSVQLYCATLLTLTWNKERGIHVLLHSAYHTYHRRGILLSVGINSMFIWCLWVLFICIFRI